MLNEDQNPDIPENNTNPDLPDDFIPQNAWPVCPKCFTPCDPTLNFCPHCDSNEPINPLASYMPFEQIRFRIGMLGKLWTKICENRTSAPLKLFYIFLIALAAPIMLIVGLPILLITKLKNTSSHYEN
jgi:hypothetical protein